MLSLPVLVALAVGALTLLVLSLVSLRRKAALRQHSSSDSSAADPLAIRRQRHAHLQALAQQQAGQAEEDDGQASNRDGARAADGNTSDDNNSTPASPSSSPPVFRIDAPEAQSHAAHAAASPMARPKVRPLATLEALLRWAEGYDGLCVACVPRRPRPFASPTRLIVCHDMKGGYVEDAHPQVCCVERAGKERAERGRTSEGERVRQSFVLVVLFVQCAGQCSSLSFPP